MKEIGGYIVFEHFHGDMLYEEALRLNCGRNALAYLIMARKIRKLAIPYFICDSVVETAEKYNAKVRFYHIGMDLRPHALPELDEDEWLYLVNYYGQIGADEVRQLKDRYHRIIVDNSQAYFSPPAGQVDTLYSCRKFFGVTDGAVLFTDAVLHEELETDQSYLRYGFLMGRFERSASEFYPQYVSNNRFFANEPVKRMSLLTDNLMHGIDYSFIRNQRTENFNYLKKRLEGLNRLRLTSPDGAFAYPLLLDNAAEVRKCLIDSRIYIPVLWPDVAERTEQADTDRMLALNILPIPCDQRYTAQDMEYICGKILQLTKPDV